MSIPAENAKLQSPQWNEMPADSFIIDVLSVKSQDGQEKQLLKLYYFSLVGELKVAVPGIDQKGLDKIYTLFDGVSSLVFSGSEMSSLTVGIKFDKKALNEQLRVFFEVFDKHCNSLNYPLLPERRRALLIANFIAKFGEHGQDNKKKDELKRENNVISAPDNTLVVNNANNVTLLSDNTMASGSLVKPAPSVAEVAGLAADKQPLLFKFETSRDNSSSPRSRADGAMSDVEHTKRKKSKSAGNNANLLTAAQKELARKERSLPPHSVTTRPTTKIGKRKK